jgi:hypothetical protein
MAANRDTDKTDTVAVELRLDSIPRLYNSLDPAPFQEKELETAADDDIVGSAEDAGGPIRLVVMLPEDELARPEAEQVPASIRHHFELRRDSERRLLRGMWRRAVDRHRVPCRLPVRAQSARRLFLDRGAYRGRRSADRRLGRHVGPARHLSLRLVADLRSLQAVRPPGPARGRDAPAQMTAEPFISISPKSHQAAGYTSAHATCAWSGG